MQRKNNILNSSKRNAFAMITAIIVVAIITTLIGLSMQLVTKTGKKATDTYLHEQVVLYSKSAAELALLTMAQNDQCTQTALVFNFPLGCAGAGCVYTANVNIQHISYDNPLTIAVNESPCATAPLPGGVDYMLVNTPQQHGSALMDITVTTNLGNEPIRYFRRVMQKL